MVNERVAPAEWVPATPHQEIIAAESRLGLPLPSPWRAFLQRPTRLLRGWLESGLFVQLHAPAEALERMDAWQPALALHPGFFLLADDGSRDMYCIDLRHQDRGVLYTDITSSGWPDAVSIGLSIDEFVQALDDGTLNPYAG